MWNDLSIADKAKFILIGVLNGIYNVDAIRQAYDSVLSEGNLFKEGGNIHQTKNVADWLSPGETSIGIYSPDGKTHKTFSGPNFIQKALDYVNSFGPAYTTISNRDAAILARRHNRALQAQYSTAPETVITGYRSKNSMPLPAPTAEELFQIPDINNDAIRAAQNLDYNLLGVKTLEVVHNDYTTANDYNTYIPHKGHLVNMYTGANYSPAYNEALNNVSIDNYVLNHNKAWLNNPEIMQAFREGGDAAAMFTTFLPGFAGPLNAAFYPLYAYDSGKRLVSSEGVPKTFRLFGEGDYWGALKSRIGDEFDMAMLFPAAGAALKGSKMAYNAGKFAYNTGKAIGRYAIGNTSAKVFSAVSPRYNFKYDWRTNRFTLTPKPSLNGVTDLNSVVPNKTTSSINKAITPIAQKFISKTLEPLNYESALSFNPLKWDDLYYEALAIGDMDRVLQLRDLHYLTSVPHSLYNVTSSGTPIPYYHGTQYGGHAVFNSKVSNATIGGASAGGKIKGNFMTPDRLTAENYARGSREVNPRFLHTYNDKYVTLLMSTIHSDKLRLLDQYEELWNKLSKSKGSRAKHTKILKLLLLQNNVTFKDIHNPSLILSNVVYPFYINTGNKVKVVDFEGKHWNQSPDISPTYHVKEEIPMSYYNGHSYVPTSITITTGIFDNKEIATSFMHNRLGNRTHPSIMYADAGNTALEAYTTPSRASRDIHRIGLFENTYPHTTNGIVLNAYDHNYDSIIMNNVIDGSDYPITDLVTLRPTQMKLTSPITYDNKGNIIPLSRRDNWLMPDIRYSLGNIGIINPKYISNGKWNSSVIMSDVKEGIENARNYFNSPLRLQVNAQNLENAKNLGFNNFDININSAERASTPIGVKLAYQPNASWLARINSPGASAFDDIMEVNFINSDAKNSAFHEMLHRSSLGIAEPLRAGESFELFLARVKGTNKYYLYQTDLLLKSRNEIPTEYLEKYDYVSEPYEAAANYFELGQRLGLKVGDPYPGDLAVIDFINLNMNNPKIAEKKGLFNLFKNTPEGRKLLWKAMTGTLFSTLTIPLITNNEKD